MQEEHTESHNPNKMRAIAQRVADGECGDFVYCLESGKFYIYEGGYWRVIIKEELLSIIENGIINITHKRDEQGNICGEIKYRPLLKFDIGNKKKTLEELKLINHKHLNEFNNNGLLNLENYMYDPARLNVISHDKKYFSTIRVPYKYDHALDCKLWEKTLIEIFEKNLDKIKSLQEFFGYCLTRDVRMEKALLLLGESRSGKSTILNTLQYMVGDENCSHVGLMNLENPQYTSMMINKLVNIDGEVSKKASDYESQFKTIVTGHEVNCNDKYVPPFKFRPFCKFVMSANIFPRITDHSSAFYKRLILIPCDRVFEAHEQNRNLRDELLNELPGILNWAVEGLKRLNKRGMFDEKEFTREAIEELENENNPCNLFFEEHIEVEVGEEIYTEKTELFNKYKQWCVKNENLIMTHTIFAKNVFKRYHKYTSKQARLHTQQRPYIWKNLRYVEFKGGQTKEEISWESAGDNISSNVMPVNDVQCVTDSQITWGDA
jgi:P4 family phage/plasmid primase-like protien